MDRLELEIDDTDAKSYLDSKSWQKIKPKTLVLGDKVAKPHDEVVRELVPQIIARKIERIIPEGYAVSQISMKVHIGGKIAGVGIEGEVTVVFGPASAASV